MPIASLANLQWNGKASMAFVDQVETDEDVAFKKWATIAYQTLVDVDESFKTTRLRGQPFNTQIVVEATFAPPRKWAQVKWVTDIAAAPTAFDIAQAVWAQQLSGFTESGSTGKALQDAGAAGNPWSADPATNNTSGTMGYVINLILKIVKFLRL
jgi:hypothetical protein